MTYLYRKYVMFMVTNYQNFFEKDYQKLLDKYDKKQRNINNLNMNIYY